MGAWPVTLAWTLPLAVIIIGIHSTASTAEGRIGNAAAAKNRVDGVLEGKYRRIFIGSEVYQNEVVRTGLDSITDLKFIDETSLLVGPTSEITLDKFIYDPAGTSGTVVIQATRGAFRFVTGTQDKKAYQIKTPYGSLGVRGTILEIVLKSCSPQIRPEACGLKVRLVEGGGVNVTTPAGRVIQMNTVNTMVTVAGNGVAQEPVPAETSILQFSSAADTTTTTGSLDANALAGSFGLNSSPSRTQRSVKETGFFPSFNSRPGIGLSVSPFR
jgi:FecR protein